MGITLQQLLRLPTSLRCHTITPLPLLNRTIESNHLANASKTRHFTTALQHLQQSRPPKPPHKIPTPRARPPPKASKPPKTQPSTLPTPDFTTLIKDHPTLLLYKSPSHTTFYLNSYIVGAAFTAGAIGSAYNSKDDPSLPKTPWIIKSLNLFVAVVFAGLATTFFLGPSKLIKTVSLIQKAVPPPPGMGRAGLEVWRPVLKFEMKHPLPFLQRIPFIRARGGGGGGAIEAPLDSVSMNKNIRGMDLTYFSADLSSAGNFTAAYFNPPPRPRQSILARLRSWNRAFIHVFPTVWQDVRRMFLRDGMAYVRIEGHGNWKLDLHGCELLDHGRPLERVMEVEERFDRSWWSALKKLLS